MSLVVRAVCVLLVLGLPACSTTRHAQTAPSDPLALAAIATKPSAAIGSPKVIELPLRSSDIAPEPGRSSLRLTDVLPLRVPTATKEQLERQATMLERLIETTEPADPEYPDLLLRLAFVYLDLEEHFEREVRAIEPEMYEAYDRGDRGRLSSLHAQHKASHQYAQRAGKSAVKVLKALVSNGRFAHYPRRDEALHHYALAMAALDRPSQRHEASLRLIREFPQSPFVPHALAGFGDFYRDKNQLKEAAHVYGKIVDEHPASAIVPYARVQRAWCVMGLAREHDDPNLAQSQEEFVAAIDRLRSQEVQLHDPGALLRDAERGLAEARARTSGDQPPTMVDAAPLTPASP